MLATLQFVTTLCGEEMVNLPAIDCRFCGAIPIINECVTCLRGTNCQLGCNEYELAEVDWTSAIFPTGLRVKDNNIALPADANALFRNGFTSTTEDLGEKLNLLEFIEQRSEAVLLCGAASFSVDADAHAAFQIIAPKDNGDGNAARTPCAIRVCDMRDNCCDCDHPTHSFEFFGFGNRIDLARSVDIAFYDADGNRVNKCGKAICGNIFTIVNLSGGTIGQPNVLRGGSINGVGTLNVRGNWEMPCGVWHCGTVNIAKDAHLDLGQRKLHAHGLQFNVDSSRTSEYLRCSGFSKLVAISITFDENALTNPNAQDYLLVDGLRRGHRAIKNVFQINGGYSLEVQGAKLYAHLEEIPSVSESSPRRTYYFGLRPHDKDWGIHPPRPPRLILPSEADADEEFMQLLNALTELELQSDESAMDSRSLMLVEFAPEDGEVTASDTCDVCAQTLMKCVDLAKSGFQNRLCDIKGNGDDPFVALIGGHARRDSIDEGICKTTYYGVVGGLDHRWIISEKLLVRVGAFSGWVRGDVRWGRSLRQRAGLVGVFGACEHFDSKLRKSNLDITLTGGFTRNHLRDEAFESAFNCCDMAADASFVRNIFAVRNMQIGPWTALSYHHIHQNSFLGEDRVTVPAIGADLLKTTLGMNFERENAPWAGAPDRLLRIYVRVGWARQAKRLDAQPIIRSVSPRYEQRNSTVVTCGFRQKIDANWEISGAWDGEFNGHYACNRANITFGYIF
ncbi:MAG: autotransporter outer membrane beta-barrel domain-containing protein [Puniceicoccales bacterium]|nr:autotransporter outer membrane beta-barrel domain-containing protein [Puniceicoccales bacterium]